MSTLIGSWLIIIADQQIKATKLLPRPYTEESLSNFLSMESFTEYSKWLQVDAFQTTSKHDITPYTYYTDRNFSSQTTLNIEGGGFTAVLYATAPVGTKDGNASSIMTLNSQSNSSIMARSQSTVVTAYYRVPSKHSPDRYNQWMKNILSLQDPMVIFTEPDLVEHITNLRKHAVNRTMIIPLSLEELPIANMYPNSFWKDQLERDPEKNIHRSYQLFWIWLSKTWFVSQAIKMNVFDSNIYVWSDIGCFRNTRYNSKTLVMHSENIPPNEVIQMAHRKPDPPKTKLFNDKFKSKSQFYHSGSQFAGYNTTLLKFHELFVGTIDQFVQHNMTIVEDQTILQSTCLSHPSLCAYVHRSSVDDNGYFGLRYVLHHEGDFQFWRIQNFTAKLSKKRQMSTVEN
jgi:hypothetical protein